MMALKLVFTLFLQSISGQFTDTGSFYVSTSSISGKVNAAQSCHDNFGTALGRIRNSGQQSELNNLNRYVWVDGSDTLSEGVWLFEDGDQFWSGGSGGNSVGGSYENWFGGNPNNANNNEDCI